MLVDYVDLLTIYSTVSRRTEIENFSLTRDRHFCMTQTFLTILNNFSFISNQRIIADIREAMEIIWFHLIEIKSTLQIS